MSVSISRPKKKTANPLHLLLLVVIAIILATLLFPVQANNQPRPLTLFHSNLKQIATAHQIYLADYDDVHPTVQDQKTYQSVVGLYIRNQKLFTDGQDDHQVNIIYNTNLSNVANASIPNKDQTITHHTPVAEEENGPITHYITAYADSAVRKHKAADWAQERQSLDWLFPRVSEDFLHLSD